MEMSQYSGNTTVHNPEAVAIMAEMSAWVCKDPEKTTAERAEVVGNYVLTCMIFGNDQPLQELLENGFVAAGVTSQAAQMASHDLIQHRHMKVILGHEHVRRESQDYGVYRSRYGKAYMDEQKFLNSILALGPSSAQKAA